jgi:hypothetical protein
LAEDARAAQWHAYALAKLACAARRDGNIETARLLQLKAQMWAERASYPLMRLLDGEYLD